MTIFLECIVYLPEAFKVVIISANVQNMANLTNFEGFQKVNDAP